MMETDLGYVRWFVRQYHDYMLLCSTKKWYHDVQNLVQ